MSQRRGQSEGEPAQAPAVAWDSLADSMVRLKAIPRAGWVLRGVPAGDAESVAAHSWGVALVALALAELHPEPVDVGRLLSMCLLHDLAESVFGDLPGPANAYLPPGAKQAAERQALADMLAGLPFGPAWQALWEEYEGGATVEAQLARDADRLDMLIQAVGYEAAGRRNLGEFWDGAAGTPWRSPGSAGLAQQLLARHDGAGQPGEVPA
jgi:putative hydrolase of HD superfamily